MESLGATEVWKGLFKLAEEAGEVVQVVGKLAVYPRNNHPDGENWREKALQECADLNAALSYFVAENFSDVEQRQLHGRTAAKLDKFYKWGLTGVLVVDPKIQD